MYVPLLSLPHYSPFSLCPRLSVFLTGNHSISDEEHARALEEQWIDALGNGGGASGGAADGDPRARAVLNGIVIGFFFPLFPFFFFRAPKPAAFWEGGHALENPESTVFSYVLTYFLRFCVSS
jgi:hypothetical protein